MAIWTTTCFLALAALTSPPNKGEASPGRFEYSQVQMGVPFKLVLYAHDERIANRAAKAAFARIKQLNGILSDYDEKSELSKLSSTAGSGKSMAISDDLRFVLRRSQRLSKQSAGAFDVTVGPLVRLWRRARRRKRMPALQRLAEASKAVGYRFLQLDLPGRTARLLQPGMRLDLGGIAKGYAADQALAVLQKMGVRRALVDGGGDIALGDPPPGKDGWRIGVAPLNAKAKPSRYLTLRNRAVATSGDAWQFVELNGKRYSHIVNPATGLGLTDRSSVTIVAPDCITADSLASAVSVLGPVKGIALVDKTKGVSAFIVRNAAGKPRIHFSRRWSDLNVERTAGP